MRIVHEHINYEISSTIGKFFDSKEFFHWHENFEICRVFNGACSFLVDGVVYDASEGDIVIINERSVHDFLVDSPDVVIELVQFPLKMLLNSGVSIKPLKTVITKEEILSVDGLDKKIDFISKLAEKENFISYDLCYRNLVEDLSYLDSSQIFHSFETLFFLSMLDKSLIIYSDSTYGS